MRLHIELVAADLLNDIEQIDEHTVVKEGSIAGSIISVKVPSAPSNVVDSDHVNVVDNTTYDPGKYTADVLFLGQVTSTPSDSDIESGNTAFYAKDDGNLYKKPYGGSEEQVGGAGGGASGRVLDVDLPSTTLGDGENIYVGNVFTAPAGASLEIYQVGVSDDTGSTYTNLALEVYDLDASSVLYSTNTDYNYAEPISTVDVGGTKIVVRVKNSTGSTHTVGANFRAEISVS